MSLALPLPIWWTLAGVYGALGLASAIATGLALAQRQQNHSELLARLRSWWMIITLFSLSLALHRTGTILFWALLSFVALREYVSLIPTRLSDRRVIIWAYSAIGLQYLWVYLGWYGMFLIFIPVYVFLFLPLRMVLIGETKGFLNAVSTIHWGVMLTVYALSHLAYLVTLPDGLNPVAGGIGLLVYLVLLTEVNDIAQYCWGKWLGRRPVIPKVSPGKTIAGLLGGIVTTTVIAAFLAPWLTPFSLPAAAGLGLLLSLTGFMGDVTVSALKRDLEIKDSGTLIPGHGGILDRIDSLTYTAPLFFHILIYFYWGGQWL
ncbi:MAG: phosphatidate cytidylyltransferase [Cyanobacteria bacterium P01_C01_bin.120]